MPPSWPAYLPTLPPTTRLILLEDKSLGRNNPILKLAEGGKDGYAREFKRLNEKELAGVDSAAGQAQGRRYGP